MNEYVKAEFMSLEVMDAESTDETIGKPDEVSFMIHLMQKELTNVKAQNILST